MNHLKILAAAATAALALLAAAAVPASATVLTDGSGNQLEAGTTITAATEETFTWHPPIGSIECASSHFGGEITDGGGATANVTVALQTLSWSSCNMTLTVLKRGSLSIAWTSGSSGTVYSTGMEVTTVFSGYHCILSTNNTKLGTITGSNTTGGHATLDIDATIPRTDGSSGFFCGTTMQWTGSFTFSSPSAINVDNEPPPPPESTVLTDGSENQLKSGTTITAESEGTIALHPPFGEVRCEVSHLGGKTTNDGDGSDVNVNVENFTWSKCNAGLTVIAKGTLSIKATTGGSGELTSTGTELTVLFSGFHCIFRTNGTKLGTITGSAITGGNATLDIEATIPRTGGSSGFFCGSTAQWTGAYKLIDPSTLNID